MPRIQALKPDVLCVCNFGRDQHISLKQATDFGLKRTTKIVVPVLLYTSRVAGGAVAFEVVVSGTSHYWGVEAQIPTTRAFNDRVRALPGGKRPSDYGALGYAGVRSVLAAVKQAGSSETGAVVAALSTLQYDFYKGPQHYRPCDHQSVQSVFIIESKSKDMANASDVFTLVGTIPANEALLLGCAEQGHT